MAEQQKPIKVRFAPLDPPTDAKGRERKQSPTVEVANGSYYRKFIAAEQPFEVTGTSHTENVDGKDREVVDITPEEELRILMADGNFVVVDEEQGAKSKSEPPAVAGGPKTSLGKIGGTAAPDAEVRV